MGQIHQILTADESKVLAAYRKMDAEQRKVVDRLRQMKRGGKDFDDQTDKTSQTMRRLAAYFAPGALIAGGIALWKRGMEEVDQTVQRITQNVKESAQSMAAFAMMQQPGKIGERTREAISVGAEYGIMPGQAWFTVQGFQAKLGDYRQGLEAARSSFALSQLAGVPMEGAKSAVSVGMGMQMTAAESARAAYAAGKASALSPAELAQMAGRGLPAFQGVEGGPIAGYGVAAALSGLIEDPGMLATYTKQVGTLLQQRTGQVGETWKKLGFAPGAPINVEERLQALAGAGMTTMGGLQEAGFAKRESLGLAILLADLPRTLETMKSVRGFYGQPGIIGRERAAAEAEVPELALQRELDMLQAQIKGEETIGTRAQWALRRDVWESRLALDATERGLGFAPFVTGPAERRRMGWFGRQAALWTKQMEPEEIWSEPDQVKRRTAAKVMFGMDTPLKVVVTNPVTVGDDRAPVAGRRGGR